MRYSNCVLASDVADVCGFPVERFYKLSRIEKGKYGKKMTINKSFKTGDVFLDAAMELCPTLDNVLPLTEFVAEQCLTRRQFEVLRNSKHVAEFGGILSFFVPSQILNVLPNPTIVCEPSKDLEDFDISNHDYDMVIKVSDFLYICAY